VADNERYSRDHPPGLPEVSPELIAAYNAQPHDFEGDFTRLKAEQDAIARELVTGIHGVDPHFLAIKRAFAQGALYMYGILRSAAQSEQLQRMFEDPTAGDGDDEGRPLSA
jgi:hypothetical protein